MDTIRRSKRSSAKVASTALAAAALGAALAAGALGAACAGASARARTEAVLPDASRQPDGVVVEVDPALPRVTERASAEGVVALRPGLSNEAVLIVVHRLFRGFTRGGIEALEALVTDDAALLGAPRGRDSLLDEWKTRLKNLSYGKLEASEIVDDAKIERFTYDELGAPGAPERPPSMKRGELLVRFPIATPRVGSEQLFGDEMTLVLRRDGRNYKIAGFGEDSGP